MQDKTNGDAQKIARRYSTKEERQAHVDSWKKSGLTMSDYCRQYNLSVANLSDWKRSVLRDNLPFKPISSLSPRDVLTNSTNLIEVIVDQRIKIRFQCVSDATLVVGVVKEL